MSKYIKPFSKSKITVFDAPFIYGYIDNFVPEEIYQKLESSFPDLDKLETAEIFKRGKKRIVFVAPPLQKEILPKDSPWLDFLEQITDSTYMQDCFSWIKDRYIKSIAANKNSYTKLFMNRFDAELNELKMQCEFSSLKLNTYLEPHTDAENKFISCIFYLPGSQWNEHWGGRTECYKPKNSKYNSNWFNRLLPIHEMDKIFECEFRPNRLFFFVKSQNSWHGISPLMTPPGIERRSFNFSMMISREIFQKLITAETQNEIRKKESEIFNPKTIKTFFRNALNFIKIR